MEKLMQRKNILLEYAAENSPKTPNRGSDEMDFNDIFGGPPRRFSMQEVRVRYSFGEAAEPEEDRAASPWSTLKEKPVFGEESVGRRRHQMDDFYDDIFRGDESISPSPRRSDQRDRDGVFGSNPGSRIMSPSRPLPPKAEPFGTSLPAHFSLPAKLTKAMEPPTFASRIHSQFKTDGSNAGLNSPHTPNNFSRFSNQPFKIQDEVRNEAHSIKRLSPLSREASCDDLPSHQKDLNLENPRKDTKANDGNGDHFHFSIYKWAGKGVPMLMPLAFGNNLRPKDLSKDDRGASSNGRMENNYTEFKLSTETDEGYIEVKKNDKRNEEEKMPKHVEDALRDTFGSKSKNAKDNVSFDGAKQNLKTDEVWPINDVGVKTKIKEEFVPKIKDPPKSKGKTLKVFLADEVTQPEKKESETKTPKGASHNKHARKTSKSNEGKGVDSTKEGVDKSSKNGVKGKVKEFVQIFNVETDSNSKTGFRARSQSYRWNTTGINQKGNGDQNLNAVKEKEKEKNLPDVDNKKPDVASLKVEEIQNKDRTEKYPQKKSSSYENRRFCFEQKNEFFSSEFINVDLKIPVENADDPFEDSFQVEELSEDHENVTQKEEVSEDIKALDAKIRQWSVGKKGNIRSLLSTLQYVLWPGSGWTPVPLVDLIEANAVKRAYQKALLRLHPDKLQQKGADASHKYTAEKVFDLLQEAWDHFNTLTPL